MSKKIKKCTRIIRYESEEMWNFEWYQSGKYGIRCWIYEESRNIETGSGSWEEYLDSWRKETERNGFISDLKVQKYLKQKSSTIICLIRDPTHKWHKSLKSHPLRNHVGLLFLWISR